MLSFSYTLLPNLKQEILNIDKTRNLLLLELLSPKNEARLRFEGLCEKVSSSLFLSGKSMNATEIENALLKEKTSERLKNVYEYINAERFITHNFLLSDDNITAHDILSVLDNFSSFKIKNKKEIDEIIEFINVTPEHGIAQAALAFILVSRVLPQDNNNISLSTLISEIYLAKHGYDFRGLLNLSKYWAADLRTLKKIINDALKNKNLSSFLEYYVYAVSIRGEATLKKIREKKFTSQNRELFELSTRQKLILSLFDTPGAKITNRDIQKQFKISQITASRDLSKLATLGLILPAGRGRSVFYTKM